MVVVGADPYKICTNKRRTIKFKINPLPRCNFFEDGGVGEESFLFKESFFPHEKTINQIPKKGGLEKNEYVKNGRCDTSEELG